MNRLSSRVRIWQRRCNSKRFRLPQKRWLLILLRKTYATLPLASLALPHMRTHPYPSALPLLLLFLPSSRASSSQRRNRLFELSFNLLPVPHSSPSRSREQIAAYIKRDFDKRYGPTWHVVVGKSFGSFCTHETNHFLYWYMGNIAIVSSSSTQNRRMQH